MQLTKRTYLRINKPQSKQ